jgi:hypothetical protein
LAATPPPLPPLGELHPQQAASTFLLMSAAGRQTLGPCSFRPGKPIPVHRFRILLLLKYSLNHFKLLKFVEICLKFIKMQIKLCMNPLKQIYSIGLTKSAFVQYSVVENYKNSNL